MDITKEYIKMCDCPEIQERWKPQIDDIVYIKNTIHLWNQIEASNASSLSRANYFIAIKKGGHYCILISNGLPNYLKKLVIWLPRQDQIQMIMMKDYKNTLDMLCDFYAVITVDQPTGFQRMFEVSMEQLWLVFYMFKKHQKKWDGKKWVVGGKHGHEKRM